MNALDPGLRIDRYEVIRPLGQGGMAFVVEVRHTDLGTRHALKVLQIQAPWLHQRLVREGRIQARLRDKHVCKVTDILWVGGAPGLVMELVEGPSLERLLASYQPNLHQMDHLARGVLAGVCAAHAEGLVHRDLKPANVLLEVEDETVIPKVADYGLAKALWETGPEGQDATRSGATLGTPCYMAPEQFRNAKHADQRADQFSLGCILYELVTGLRPFAGELPLEIYEATSQGRFRAVRDMAPNVPGRMAEAITRALSPKPDDRFPDCQAFLQQWRGEVADAEIEGAWEPDHIAFVRSLVARTLASPEEGPPVVEQTASVGARQKTIAPPARGQTAIPASQNTEARSLERSPEPRWAAMAGLSALGLLGGAGAALLAGGAVLGMLWWRGSTAQVRAAEPGAVEREPVVPIEVQEPSPRAEDEPEPAGIEPIEQPVLQRPVPLVPESVPGSGTSDAATLTVTGVERAWLVDESGAYLKPGALPPGKYSLVAFFVPEKATAVMDVTLAPSQRREIECDVELKRCR